MFTFSNGELRELYSLPVSSDHPVSVSFQLDYPSELLTFE
jgi:hypothetical protein